jgi:enoyl-CoA hydratase/carnithine racemase
LDQLGRLEIPTLAAVQGGCAGGGFELAMTCDMIVAGRSAWFSCPEAAVGILTLHAAPRAARSRTLGVAAGTCW